MDVCNTVGGAPSNAVAVEQGGPTDERRNKQVLADADAEEKPHVYYCRGLKIIRVKGVDVVDLTDE